MRTFNDNVFGAQVSDVHVSESETDYWDLSTATYTHPVSGNTETMSANAAFATVEAAEPVYTIKLAPVRGTGLRHVSSYEYSVLSGELAGEPVFFLPHPDLDAFDEAEDVFRGFAILGTMEEALDQLALYAALLITEAEFRFAQ